MKKILAMLMVGAMAVTSFAGCSVSVDDKSSSSSESDSSAASDVKGDSKATEPEKETEDWTYLANKGSLTIGITYFEPMNYKDKEGKLTGFETEFAEAVCAELGLKADFQEIEWDTKELELNSKSIDCIWNGMTITDERKENMDISVPYMQNKQVMVCKKDKVNDFAESVEDASVVAEAGSAGEEVANSDEFFKEADFENVESQATALLEVKAGTADVAVIDYIMALGTLREGSDFEDLAIVDAKSFAPEEYGIALRKGSTTALPKLNAAIQKVADSGKLKEIADKYNLSDMLLVKPAA